MPLYALELTARLAKPIPASLFAALSLASHCQTTAVRPRDGLYEPGLQCLNLKTRNSRKYGGYNTYPQFGTFNIVLIATLRRARLEYATTTAERQEDATKTVARQADATQEP
jgi:hypothetical protein